MKREPALESLAVAPPAPLIELTDVARCYGAGDLAVHALRGVSLAIYPGEFVAIMGASGSGKSTLMNILGCLDRPTSGTYRFRGEDVSALGRDELARLRREAFGFVFQSYNLIANATALENVEVPALYAGVPAAERHARAAQRLASLGLADRLDHRPAELSGGQQQRVSIARALMNGGEIVLADEPTGALDSASGEEVMALLAALAARGHTVIVITHSPEVAARADRVIEIRDGGIVRDDGRAPRAGAGASLRRPDADARVRTLLAEAGEAWRTAIRSLRANLFRTVLTLLGIVIGVASVIVMLAIGDGARQAVMDRMSTLGTNLLQVRAMAPPQRGVGGAVATLVPGDAAAIATLPNVDFAVPEAVGTFTLRFGNADYQTQVISTTAEFAPARDWPVARGTFLSVADVERYATSIVLGQTVVDHLFAPDVDPIGKYVVVNTVLFQVVGVMAPRGASPWGSDLDDVAFVPLTTGGLRLLGHRSLRSVIVAVADVARIDATQEAVTALLTERHGRVDFQVRNMASIIQAATETQDTLTVLLASIAAISLLVGGIGVMNIMLVSVTERTREIGIRMATGARTRDILQQFLAEALVVAGVGGLIGVAIGLGVGAVLEAFGRPIQFNAGPVVLAFGCAFLTGLVFGYMPARKAARLDPVAALAAE